MEKETPFPDLEHIRDRILEYANEDVEFIALFGSQARGSAQATSDTDIAIKTNITDKITRGNLRLRLNSVLSGPTTRIDIVTIEDVDWELRYRIARDGKVLTNRNDSWQEFVESVIKYYPDYHTFFSRILDQSIRRETG